MFSLLWPPYTLTLGFIVMVMQIWAQSTGQPRRGGSGSQEYETVFRFVARYGHTTAT